MVEKLGIIIDINNQNTPAEFGKILRKSRKILRKSQKNTPQKPGSQRQNHFFQLHVSDSQQLSDGTKLIKNDQKSMKNGTLKMKYGKRLFWPKINKKWHTYFN